MPGVYLIFNYVTGKLYVGSSKHAIRRIQRHISRLNLGSHENDHLQRSWNKYRAYSFWFQVIEWCDLDSLMEREQFWIDTLNPNYNILRRAGSLQGVTVSPEACKRRGKTRMASTLKRWGFTEDEITYHLSRGITRARQAYFSSIGGRRGEHWSHKRCP